MSICLISHAEACFKFPNVDAHILCREKSIKAREVAEGNQGERATEGERRKKGGKKVDVNINPIIFMSVSMLSIIYHVRYMKLYLFFFGEDVRKLRKRIRRFSADNSRKRADKLRKKITSVNNLKCFG